MSTTAWLFVYAAISFYCLAGSLMEHFAVDSGWSSVGEAEFREIGGLIAEVVEGLRKNGEEGDAQVEQSVARRVGELCARFPIYPG